MRYKPAHATPTGTARTLPVPVTLAAVMTAAATSGAYLQTRDASAAGNTQSASAQALLAGRLEAAQLTTSRTAARAALLRPLASTSRYAHIDPDRTPSIPAALTADAPSDTRRTVKLKRELTVARVAMERSGAAYASAKTNAARYANALRALNGTLLTPTATSTPAQLASVTGEHTSLAQVQRDLRLARMAELAAGDVHRSNIAHATSVMASVRAAVAGDVKVRAAREDAAIARGEIVRLPDGTTARMPDLGTPIRGNGWTLTPQVRIWIAESLTTLYANGFPRHEDDALNLATIIYNESAGDPGSKNLYDSNAAAGMPSFGLMQTIGPTFQAYALPGHTKTSDPHAQIMAGARYAVDVYDSLANVPGVRSLAHGGPYLPY